MHGYGLVLFFDRGSCFVHEYKPVLLFGYGPVLFLFGYTHETTCLVHFVTKQKLCIYLDTRLQNFILATR